MPSRHDPRFNILQSILHKLDRRECFNKDDIMEEFGISERSFYRYKQVLIDIGYPVEYDKEKECYRFPPEYRLAHARVSPETALTFALTKAHLGAVNPELKERFEEVERRIFAKETEIPPHIVIKPDGFSERFRGHFEEIQRALDDLRRIRITYDALYSGEVTTRKVDPYYLFYDRFEGIWNLRAYCHLREDFRTFALDRIKRIKVLDEHFLPRRLDKDEELAGAFGPYLDGEPVEVLLRFSPDIKSYVLRKRWHESQVQEELEDGRLEVRFKVNGLEGIKPWIYMWLPHVEVVEPEELIREMRSDLQQALGMMKQV